jgi:hypothetical protein
VKAIVHIGTEKTGSTSIQRMLRANVDPLKSRGFLTAPFLGPLSHIGLAVVALPDEPVLRWHRRVGVSSPDDVPDFRRRASRRLRRMHRHEGSTLLLSCEQLSHLANDEAKVDRLANWLTELGFEPEVLVYLRRQDRFLESSHQQKVKAGATDPLHLPPEESAGRGSVYDYWSMLNRWSRVFGVDAVRPRVFDRSTLVRGDVVLDYLACIGVDDPDAIDVPKQFNPSLSADAAEFLRLMNRHVPARGSGRIGRGNLSLLLREMAHDDPPLRLPSADAEEFVARFRDGNRLIALQYLGTPGDLFPAIEPREPEHSQPVLSLDRAVELASNLWVEKQIELTRLRRTQKEGKRRPDGV